jgi:hypothetical protein
MKKLANLLWSLGSFICTAMVLVAVVVVIDLHHKLPQEEPQWGNVKVQVHAGITSKTLLRMALWNAQGSWKIKDYYVTKFAYGHLGGEPVCLVADPSSGQWVRESDF